MNEAVQLDRIQNVCRLCLSKNVFMMKIFDPEESAISLADKIYSCLSIKISLDDKLSTTICEKCHESVRHWHTYKQFCLKSQERLLEWLDSQTNSSMRMVMHVKSESRKDQGSMSIVYRNRTSHGAEKILVMPGDELPSFYSDPRTNEVISISQGVERRRCRVLHEENVAKHQAIISIAIKNEPEDDSVTDQNIDMDSIAESELLINPMALATSKDISESDSSRKFTSTCSLRKNLRRRPHTHFRGAKVFKRKCLLCQIHLHSKFSYSKHMEIFHQDMTPISKKNPLNLSENGKSLFIKNVKKMGTKSIERVEEGEESIEDVEDELVLMEKNAPLTEVQENIISQLKTFSCYSCQQVFGNRRSTLNHIRQHMPDLRPYTCIACLTEFPDRSIYKLHCGASFECAMKIALVVPENGIEKYFTCNMCLRPLPNRRDLLSHLSRHSDRQYEQLTTPFKCTSKPMPINEIGRKTSRKKNTQGQGNFIDTINTSGPYENGDPSHNHTCIYCGMIYKYKPNMVKHRDLCERLPASERNCYRCAHCGMTFLILKKFQSHIVNQHNRKHRSSELQEHRHSHPRSENFTSEFYRKNLPNSEMLQERLLEHDCFEVSPILSSLGLELQGSENKKSQFFSVHPENPAPRSTKCGTCDKIFANYPNLRRHIRTAHIVGGKFSCPKCQKTFTSEDSWMQHAERAHPRHLDAPMGAIKCQQCKKLFQDIEAHAQHLTESHGIDEDDHMACDICGKRFSNETSLKIHRGHHFRRDSRLSIRHVPNPMDQVQVEIVEERNEFNLNSVKLENSIVNDPNLIYMLNENSGNLQCVVCDDIFNDVHDLRKHLWDIHCAKNKCEKSLNESFQCDLCSNVFLEEQTLNEHLKWHKENSSLLGPSRSMEVCCDICGKFYSSAKSLTKHKKLHKLNPVTVNTKFQSVKKNVLAQFPCPVCKKMFDNDNSMKKHKAGAHHARRTSSMINLTNKTLNTSTIQENNIRSKRPKLDFDLIRKAYHLGEPSRGHSGISNTTKKPVTCGICKKLLPSMSSLYKHRKNIHQISSGKYVRKDDEYNEYNDSARCFANSEKIFNTASMNGHNSKVDGTNDKYHSKIDDCDGVIGPSLAKQRNEQNHGSMLYSCALCSRYMFNRGAIKNHLISEHQRKYHDSENGLFEETDLTKYEVKGAEGRVCPVCHIKYPNIKAMKVHYIKIHEGNV